MRSVNDAEREDRRLLWLKRWIWVYFWLLIFEGALRKWIFTPLSGPLLVVRDPIALIIYFQAYRCGKFSMKTMWPFALLTLALLLLGIAQVVEGVNTVEIALYGMRSYVLHLPLAVVMLNTLCWEDIRKVGRWLLWLSVPMTALMVLQFRAPSHSFLNAGAGEGALQIGSALGHVRPAGTFSFGIGAQVFTILVAAFVLYALTRPGTYPRWLLWPAAVATVASIPLLASRGVVFQMVALTGFVFYAGLSHVGRVVGLAKLVVVLGLASIVASQLPFFHDTVDTFARRWQSASQSEGDTQDVLSKRVLGAFQNGIEASGTTPLLGEGIGMGSNFASFMKTGTVSFLLAEGEWERVVLEFGPILGMGFMLLRLLLVGWLWLMGLRAMRQKDTLAWLLVPVAANLIIMAAMEQPTYLGFMVFVTGLCLASARAAMLSAQSPVYPAQQLEAGSRRIGWKPNRVRDGQRPSSI
jgi:hypothetical protein